MQDQLHALISNHCSWVRAQVQLIEDGLAPILGQTAGEPKPGLLEAREQTHQITGTSGTMGFPLVSSQARALEARLEVLADSSGPVSADDLADIAMLLANLRHSVGDVSPESSSLFGVDLSQIAR